MNEKHQSRSNSVTFPSPPLHNSPLSHDYQLKIKRIIGTSAADRQQISVQDDLVAYTASGGVVVCKIDKETNSVVNQRFFCANSSYSNESKLQSSRLGAVSSANAYLNMIQTDYNSEEAVRDEYGYPIACQPIEIYGNSFSPGDIDEYPANNASPSLSVTNQTSPSKLKDKVRSIKCIAISPNKRILAIGESGYQPRILIFSLAPSSQQSPVMAIYEHTFGISNLVFSSDSKFLCSLGVVNDGCINVWRVGSNSVQLQASNRCSNIIHKVIWQENIIVTIGLRFIKLWKFENGSTTKPVILKGRNAHLGDFMNSNFIDMTLLNDDEILLVANCNQLLLLKLSFDSPKLVPLKSPDFEFCSLVADGPRELIWLGDRETSLAGISTESLFPINASAVKPVSSPSTAVSNSLQQQLSGVFGIEPRQSLDKRIIQISNFSSDYLLYLTTNEEIVFRSKELTKTQLLATSIIRQIGGVKKSYDGEYLAFSKSGTIEQFNPNSCDLAEIFQFGASEAEAIGDCLTAIEKVGNLFVMGYKFGSLYIVQQDCDTAEVLFTVKAHSSTINEIVCFQHGSYEIICSISRDRMIQVFAKIESKWDLLQTIPVHNGNLLEAIYHDGFLYVCSTDRTISIHSITTDPSLMLTKVKSLTLKSTPVTMSIFDRDLVVSTSDKQVLVFDLDSNHDLKRSLKLFNDKVNESLLVEMMEKFHNLLIVWSSDKSIRGFDYITGRPVGVGWGHSDSLLGLFLIHDSVSPDADPELVTIGNDGCLFSWRITESSATLRLGEEDNGKIILDDALALSPSPVFAKVARKILPTVPKSTTSSTTAATSSSPKKEKLLDRLEQVATGSKPKVQLPASSPTPQSPTPKLTAATLRRIEARNGSIGGGETPNASPRSLTSLSPTRSKSVSPVRPSVNSRPSSPTRASTKNQPFSGGLFKLNQPLLNSRDLPSPQRRPSSPRTTSDSSVSTKPNGPTSNPSRSQTVDIRRKSNSQAKSTSSTSMALLDKCINQLDELINNVDELHEDERRILLNKVNQVKYKLNDGTTSTAIYNQEDLLNKYSDKLVELVEAKLSGSSISE
ncbi:hypothetical protein CANMA_002687 [Candida margitis]|uniref:uncharacterized protein n=1 Tax=Candida margitis TaxID=1775924 RepID=UPI0022261FB1|nr:uncharacterized protein CANMA_002687 [Candida margitis]KAI5967919.1 hypothetical protein CANMA_002687 [Candida margitis]